MKKDNIEARLRENNPLAPSARFLSARPDLVGAWIIGAHGLLPIFRSENREAIVAFLEAVQHEFFAALTHHFEKKNPKQNLVYSFGTICRNERREERLVIGIKPEKSGKPVYDYIDDNGIVGACNESSMRSWIEKR
jgi:hypothetical protein